MCTWSAHKPSVLYIQTEVHMNHTGPGVKWFASAGLHFLSGFSTDCGGINLHVDMSQPSCSCKFVIWPDMFIGIQSMATRAAETTSVRQRA